jgi:signal transduction histidine kinase
MRRLFHKIYLTIIVSLMMVVVVAGAIWRAGWEQSPAGQAFEMAGELAAAGLPPADASRALQQQAIERLAQHVGTDLALYDSSRALVARTGDPLPPPPARDRGGWIYGPGGAAWGLRLPDGRTLVARAPMRHRHPAVNLMFFLGIIALVVGACAYPVVRGLTRRLERLQTGVETLGAGDLSARVMVTGRDEVARLGSSFNRAAARIEELVDAHRMLLSNASHELRTPLSRIRLGIELFQEKGDPKYKAELERDIAELDLLIEEILLASRLDAKLPHPGLPPLAGEGREGASEEVDLLALAVEECAHYDCAPEGESVTIRGDPRLLRRLVRNLLENARRHGKLPVRVEVRPEHELAVLSVMDVGKGIPEAERERVFLPFHRVGADTTGTGLGLALVRQIARLHGGDAVVAPRAGAPGCFRITLPRCE